MSSRKRTYSGEGASFKGKWVSNHESKNTNLTASNSDSIVFIFL